MRKLLRYLKDSGAPELTKHVPRVPLPAPRDVIVTEAERDLILNAAPMYLRCWLLLCSDLALRSGTAARLAPKHYNQETREVSIVTKAGRSVHLPVTDELANIFAAVSDRDPETPFVHQLHRRCKVNANYLRNVFWRLRHSLGITRDLRAHDLRRTTAVKALDITGDLRLVQALLGHTQLRSTLHYLDHRNTTVPRELVEAIAQKGRNPRV